MFQNMFDRLLALFLVVILLMAVTSASFSVFTTRGALVNSRMESLQEHAREIAYLAGRLDDVPDGMFSSGTTMNYLQWKAKNVYEDYGAYILIVDHSGRIMDNMQIAMNSGDTNLRDTLNTEEISQVMMDVLKGREVQTRISRSTDGGAILTVAVPYMQNDKVHGAVLIHTSAQIIEAPFYSLLLQITLGFFLASVVALVGATLYTKGILRPLTVITNAAESMSRGKLSTRAAVTGVSEVRQLAGAFNVMAQRLEKEENNRKEFVSNVSHELRSPVTSIHGFVEGMLDGTIPPEEHERYLRIVFDETNRMKRLITDLLQLSRMDNGAEKLQWSDFDINEQIRLVLIGRMNDIEEKSINVQLDFRTEPCLVHADKDRIAQVIHNIVDNALKYVEEKDSLTIRTFLLHDNRVSVEIENSGEPIAQKDKPHIFDRFYMAEKAHTSGKGTGLGLSICKQIIDMHGQTIELMQLEEGAGFRFTLQAAAPPDKPRLSA